MFPSVSKSLEMNMIPYLKQCARVVLATVYLLYFHVHSSVCWPVARQNCVYDVNLCPTCPSKYMKRRELSAGIRTSW